MLREQQVQIEALKQQIEAAKTNVPPAPMTAEEAKELNSKVDQVVEAQKKVRPGEFNPAIGLVGETIFSYRSKGSNETGSDRPGGIDIWQGSVALNIAPG